MYFKIALPIVFPTVNGIYQLCLKKLLLIWAYDTSSFVPTLLDNVYTRFRKGDIMEASEERRGT